MHTFSDSELDRDYSDKYSITMGVTVRGFTFNFSNLENLLRNLMEQSQDLIEKETGTEQTSSVKARVHFFPE